MTLPAGVLIPDEDLARLSHQAAERYATLLRALIANRRYTEEWEAWLRVYFGAWVSDPNGEPVPFGDHHREMWRWIWAIQRGVRPEAFVAIWPRGGAKSTTAELGCVAVAARRSRRYGIFVCSTQDQADDHVGNVGALLESPILAVAHPELSKRAVGKYGNSKGWRRNRLRTPYFTLDAIGLDTASRGAKVDQDRPDFMVLDDIDDSSDSTIVAARKIDTLCRKLIPAGSTDLAVLAIQNLIRADGVFGKIVSGEADYLSRRIVSGPIPALRGAAYEERDGRWMVVSGSPTWEGQDLAACQSLLGDMTMSAFRTECQHELQPKPGGMFAHIRFRHCAPQDVPDLVETTVWVDPAVSDTDKSDRYGIQVDGVAVDGTIYRLVSWEERTSTEDALMRAYVLAVRLGCATLGIETDQGGDTWRPAADTAWRYLVAPDEEVSNLTPALHVHRTSILRACVERGVKTVKRPRLEFVKAGSYGSKVERADWQLREYEGGKVVHVLGDHETLEMALRRFPVEKPYDLVDAASWSVRYLRERVGSSIIRVMEPREVDHDRGWRTAWR